MATRYGYDQGVERKPRAVSWRGGQAVVVLAGLLALGPVGVHMRLPGATRSAPAHPPTAMATGDLPLIALAPELVPISPDEAVKRNQLRPIEVTGFIPAKPFIIARASQADPHYAAAVECLTQAVYYEAGYEPAAGMRAVAQVVLNRVRHPAFPNSVCGVVYQGYERSTGCQFTFTCDGSLFRTPGADAWRRSRLVAIAALNGWVEAGVGLATNYHADYVLPYWASSLDKMATIGRHIFYGNGRIARSVFAQPYAFVDEHVPVALPLAAASTEPAQLVPDPVLTDMPPLVVGTPAPLAADRAVKLAPVDPIAVPKGELEADRHKGELIINGSQPKLLRE